jgi:chromosome segregation ATPase
MERLVWEERGIKAENALEKAEIEAFTLKKEINDLKKRTLDLETQDKDQSDVLKTLQQALADTKRINALQAAELLFNQTQIQTLERSSTAFQAQVSLLTSESETSLLHLNSLKQAKDTLEDQLAASHSAHRLLSEDLESLQNQMNSLRCELSQTQNKLKMSEQAEERLTSKKEELTERLVWYQAEYEKASALKKANIQLTERNLALSSELRSLSDKSQS